MLGSKALPAPSFRDAWGPAALDVLMEHLEPTMGVP
jgi:hypothetical protein